MAAKVVACSDFTRSWIIEHEGLPAENITTVHYGLPPEAFEAPLPCTVQELREEFSIGDNDVILLPARLVASKGQALLIDAIPNIRSNRGRDVRVILLGDGPDRASLEHAVAQSHLRHVVHFAGYRSDPRPFYRLADVTVLPTVTDAFPQVVIESMAQGTPVVASAVGGIPESIGTEAGLLVNDTSPGTLGGAVRMVLDDPPRRAAMGAAGARIARERFTAELMLSRLALVYGSLLRPGAQEY